MVEVNYKGLRISVVSFCDLGMNYETTAQLIWPGSGSLQTLNGPDDMGRVSQGDLTSQEKLDDKSAQPTGQEHRGGHGIKLQRAPGYEGTMPRVLTLQ